MTARRMAWPTALVAVIAMGLVLRGALVYDAAQLLLHDARYAAPIDWGGLLTTSYWPTGLWRPITSTLLGAQAALGGPSHPIIFHLTSLFLYVAVSVMLVRLLFAWSGNAAASAVAGSLFAAHPVHVEVVASVVGQAELLAALGLMGGAWVWHRAARDGVTRGTIPLLLGAQCLAALSKEQGFVLPALLVGQHLLLPQRLPRRDAIRIGTPLVLLVIMLLLIRTVVTGSVGGETPLPFLASLGVVGRVVTAFGVVPDFVRLLVWPLHLQGEYGPPELMVGLPFTLHHLVGLVLVLVGAIGFVKWRKTVPLAAFGIWWIVVTWLPTSSLILPAGVMLAERLLFLPSIGAAMVVAGLGATLPVPLRRPAVLAMLLLTAAFTIRSVVRVPVWRTPARFFTTLTTDAPDVYRAWYVSGVDAQSRGDSVGAERLFRHSLSIWDSSPVVHEALGQLLRREGRCTEAVPIMTEGLVVEPSRTQLRAKLGECLLQVGDSTRAAAVARDGIAIGQEEFTGLLERAGR
ncbi:MAG: hypothetical protein ABI542_07115 [Gemmatimonadota bacterium]